MEFELFSGGAGQSLDEGVPGRVPSSSHSLVGGVWTMEISMVELLPVTVVVGGGGQGLDEGVH